MRDRLVLFVHGWGVHDTATYGELPDRLAAEAERDGGLRLDVRHIWLSRYISFRDEVRMDDLVRAFDAALQRELGGEIRRGRRIVCITHSTGGPLVRRWWERYYLIGRRAVCPLSHVVMLAPPNFGSALSQLGRQRLSRLKAWSSGVEPGTGVLDWLELGSPESSRMNRRWIKAPNVTQGDGAVFFFVLAGQTIDRKLYDHVNSYTSENGSDGVVRLASAQLNGCYLRLEQEPPARTLARRPDPKTGLPWARLLLKERVNSQLVAFRLIEGCAHSGELGIVTGVRNDGSPHPTVDAILEAVRVEDARGYREVAQRFAADSARVAEREKVEIVERDVLSDWEFIHDRCSMIVFRMRDDSGAPLDDFDLLLTGDGNDPDGLPRGFFVDRQRNQRHHSTITYYVNYDMLTGSTPVVHPATGAELRGASVGLERFGIRVLPQPQDGVVSFLPAQLSATVRNLRGFLEPDQTSLVDVVVRRVVREGTFGLTRERRVQSFKRVEPGGAV